MNSSVVPQRPSRLRDNDVDDDDLSASFDTLDHFILSRQLETTFCSFHGCDYQQFANDTELSVVSFPLSLTFKGLHK